MKSLVEEEILSATQFTNIFTTNNNNSLTHLDPKPSHKRNEFFSNKIVIYHFFKK